MFDKEPRRLAGRDLLIGPTQDIAYGSWVFSTKGEYDCAILTVGEVPSCEKRSPPFSLFLVLRGLSSASAQGGERPGEQRLPSAQIPAIGEAIDLVAIGVARIGSLLKDSDCCGRQVPLDLLTD